jgi:hypothetical protein
MQEEFGPKGLVVVGVTNEPESLVTKHIDKKKMNFPVAIVGGDDFDRAYGVRAFPSSDSASQPCRRGPIRLATSSLRGACR